MMRHFSFALLLCTMVLVAGAQNTTPSPAAAQSPVTQIAPADYVLQTGDSFSVVYRYTPEYNQSVAVQPDGRVTLTLLGPVPVRGLTVEEARQRIIHEASKRFNAPEISLALNEYVRPHFTVLGEVNTPGRYELRGSLSAFDGLALAGGLKENAKKNNILVIHRVSQTLGETVLINYKALMKAHPGQELSSLRDGDLIIVPQTRLSKIEHFIKLSNAGLYYPI